MALFCIISSGGKHLSKEQSGIWKEDKTIGTLNCLVFACDASAMKQMCQQSYLLLDQIFKQKNVKSLKTQGTSAGSTRKKMPKASLEGSIQRKQEVR